MNKINREHFNLSEEPENEHWVRGFEEGSRKRIIEQSGKSPELTALLEKVDFNSLRDIFGDIAEKSGVNPGKMNFINPGRISHFLSSKVDERTGEFGLAENIIYLSYETNKRKSSDIGINKELMMFHVLCHEEVHAVSYTSCTGLRELIKNESGMFRTKSGFSIGTVEKDGDSGRSDLLFKFFDEGVTEKLAREITSRYLTENQDFSDAEAIKKFEDVLNSKKGKMSYDGSVIFLENFIKHISSEVGLDENDVWHAIIRGKIEGIDFNDVEFIDAFSKMFPQNFLDDLSRVSSDGQMVNLIERLNLQEDVKEKHLVIGKLKKWLTDLSGRNLE